MGFVSTGDSFNLRGDEAIQGLENTQKIVDDIIVSDEEFDEHIIKVEDLLRRCRKYGITLAKAKFRFAEERVKFAGFIITPGGIEADPKKIQALLDLPQPTCLTELRGFMGAINQLRIFDPKISKVTGPLRDLLKKKSSFLWLPVHQNAFEAAKKLITSPPTLALFDPKLPTRLETDASKLNGFGFVLRQQHGSEWKIVVCGSRFLRDPELNYSVIDLEALAIQFAIKKCHLYLSGLEHFTVHTDHRGLVPIFNSKRLSDIESEKIRNVKATLSSQYQFSVKWVKGKDNAIPDLLSRFPTSKDEENSKEAERMVICAVSSLLENNSETLIDPLILRMKEIANNDEEYVRLVNDLESRVFDGEKVKVDSPGTLTLALKAHWLTLKVENGLVLLGNRLIVPREMRPKILNDLHAAHQGIHRIQQRARRSVFWPGISNEIKQIVEACSACQEKLPSQPKEPLMSDAKPSRPFEEVSSDLFTIGGKHFLVYVCRLSGYPLLAEWMHSPSAQEITTVIRQFFSDLGVPTIFRSDGGTVYASKCFQDFLDEWNVHWSPSSPHFPSSNGFSEVYVRQCKHLLAKLERPDIKSPEFQKAILELRNTPRYDGFSPCEIVFGHNLRSFVPTHRDAFSNKWAEFEKFSQEREEKKMMDVEHYNSSAKSLPLLKIGDEVRLQDPTSKKWLQKGRIMGHGLRKRDYHVRLDSGRILWRNRRFLRLSRELDEAVNDNETNVESVDQEDMPRRSTRSRKAVVRFQI